MKQNISLVQLQEFLNNTDIPKIKKQPKTFLGIAKQPHYENVMSNILAFYFDPNEEHNLQDLFTASFLELIGEQDRYKETIKTFEFSDYRVQTEVSTTKGGRIDILLHNNEKAIIIENKVYHHLKYNDLEDYWTSTKHNLKATERIGVVLSLRKENVSHPHFINITHRKFLTRVIKNLKDYEVKASPKYLIFLKDLYQNTINLSTKTMNTKDIEFYKKHRDEILQTARFLSRFKTHVIKETERACNILNSEREFLKLSNTGRKLRFFLSKEVPNLMFTVGFENLYNEKKRLWIAVELKGDIPKHKERFKDIEWSKSVKDTFKEKFFIHQGSNWAHFVSKSYDSEIIPFQKLSNFIVERIKENQMLSVFNTLEDILIKEKKAFENKS